MLTALLIAALPAVQSVQEAEEKLQRRITPVVQVVARASPAVVYIQTDGFKYTRFFDQLWSQRVSGSGTGVVTV